MLAFKVLPGLVALLRSRASSLPSFWHHFHLDLVSYGPTVVSLKHLLSVCLRSSMPATNHHHTWTHRMSMSVVQLRYLFCFPKALLCIKNEKVVLCFHAQHENRISCWLSMPFLTAIYAKSLDQSYHLSNGSYHTHHVGIIPYYIVCTRF